MEEGIRARLERRAARERLKALRWFGGGLAVILGLVALSAWRRGGAWAPAEAALAAAFLAAGLFKPEALSPVYVRWMKVAGAIGQAVGFVLMAALFYGVFTPYAWLLRRLGGALAPQEPLAGSYWVARTGPPAGESYKLQF